MEQLKLVLQMQLILQTIRCLVLKCAPLVVHSSMENKAIVADGIGVELRLFAVNFNHIGAGKDFSNDGTLTVQANETTELNDGKISFVSVDQDSNFRVGDSFVVNQDTGSVSFAATTYSLDITGDIDVTDGTNTSNLSPTSLSVGTLRIAGDTLSSVSGDININPAGSNETNVEGNLNVTGILTAAVLQVSAVQKGDTSIAIEDTGSNGTIRLNTDGVEALTVSNTQFVGIGSANPTKKLDVVGETGNYFHWWRNCFWCNYYSSVRRILTFTSTTFCRYP